LSARAEHADVQVVDGAKAGVTAGRRPHPRPVTALAAARQCHPRMRVARAVRIRRENKPATVGWIMVRIGATVRNVSDSASLDKLQREGS
jgi:hypothetical protein